MCHHDDIDAKFVVSRERERERKASLNSMYLNKYSDCLFSIGKRIIKGIDTVNNNRHK